MSDFNLDDVREAILEIERRRPVVVVHPSHPQLDEIEDACRELGVRCNVTEGALDPPDVVFIDPSKLQWPDTFEIDFGDHKLPVAPWPDVTKVTDVTDV